MAGVGFEPGTAPDLRPGVMRERGIDRYASRSKRSECVGTRLGIPVPLSVIHPIGEANRVVPIDVISRKAPSARHDAVFAAIGSGAV